MKRYVFIFAAAVLIVTTIYSNKITPNNFSPATAVDNPYTAREEALLKFIQKNLMTEDGGIFTKLGNPGENKSTLSESVGLLMEYSLLKNRKDIFDKELYFAEKNLFVIPESKSGSPGRYIFVKWKSGNGKTSCNAAVDDLRIAGALMDAYDKWGDKKYYDLAGFIQLGLYDKQTIEDGICELYDWGSNSSKLSMPLCYLDFYPLVRLDGFNKSWKNILDRGLSVVRNGRIGGSGPFFYKYYDYETHRYSMDEEYAENKGVCLIYTLLTAIHMTEANEDTGFITEWLRKEISKGKLYGWYNPYTLEPTQEFENTAVYALAAIYSYKQGEKELYGKFVDNMLKFMVTDRDSPYYGGFGLAATGEFYSFDNLTALYALALGDNRGS